MQMDSLIFLNFQNVNEGPEVLKLREDIDIWLSKNEV